MGQLPCQVLHQVTGRTESRTVRGKPRYRAAVYVGVREAERSGGRLEHRTYYGPWRSRLRRSPSDPSADADLDRLRDELEALLSGPVSASDPGTVADLLTRWQRDCVAPDKRPNTIRHHAKNAALHIVPSLGMCRAAALSPADVAEWQAAEIAAGAAPKSVRSYRATLHACYAWAHALGLVPSNTDCQLTARTLPKDVIERLANAVYAGRDGRLRTWTPHNGSDCSARSAKEQGRRRQRLHWGSRSQRCRPRRTRIPRSASPCTWRRRCGTGITGRWRRRRGRTVTVLLSTPPIVTTSPPAEVAEFWEAIQDRRPDTWFWLQRKGRPD